MCVCVCVFSVCVCVCVCVCVYVSNLNTLLTDPTLPRYSRNLVCEITFHTKIYTQWIWISYWLETKNYMDLVSRTTWEINIFLFSAFWYHHFFDFLNFLEFRFSISGFSHLSLVCPLMKPPQNRTITLQPIRKANSHIAYKDNQVQICPSTDPFS